MIGNQIQLRELRIKSGSRQNTLKYDGFTNNFNTNPVRSDFDSRHAGVLSECFETRYFFRY